ncbi:hypothetical protein PDJAM_G00204150 [Pangasius djambal]|uniref:Uncharacterized protein n=2 Tax=Pangasiidae TaxID=7999 RepID=A0ACC5WFT2_PANGG|nr:hypothetical protein [Pangasianodon gigas]MCJ8731843.1 hypothetical protein [Pangasius djambal]
MQSSAQGPACAHSGVKKHKAPCLEAPLAGYGTSQDSRDQTEAPPEPQRTLLSVPSC